MGGGGAFWGEAGGLNLSDWYAQLHKDTHLHTLKCTYILLHSWECQDCGDASRSETLPELYDSALEVCVFPSVGSSFCWSGCHLCPPRLVTVSLFIGVSRTHFQRTFFVLLCVYMSVGPHNVDRHRIWQLFQKPSVGWKDEKTHSDR